jgi:hypothetical protein
LVVNVLPLATARLLLKAFATSKADVATSTIAYAVAVPAAVALPDVMAGTVTCLPVGDAAEVAGRVIAEFPRVNVEDAWVKSVGSELQICKTLLPERVDNPLFLIESFRNGITTPIDY